MVIYRPNREFIYESMKDSKEFETIDDMKKYIVEQWTSGEGIKYFDIDDIVIDSKVMEDSRTHWRDCRYVCVKRMGNIDCIEKYSCPQCIGTCATDYDIIDYKTLPYPFSL